MTCTDWMLKKGGLALAACLLAAPALMAADSPATQLEDIEVQALSGQQVQLRLRLSGPAPEPLSFTINEPARIAIDLPDTGLAMSDRRTDVQVGPVNSVSTAEAGGRTRVVINLDEMVAYETRVEDGSIVVVVGGAGTRPAATATFTAAPEESADAGAGGIEDIDFRRGEDGSGRVLVTLSDPRTAVDVRQEGGRIVVDFQDTNLPRDLMQRYDVLDFATPVKFVEAVRADGDARLIVEPTGRYEQVAYQSDDLFTLELAPVPDSAPQAEAAREYTGERLTLNFQDIETRAVLQLLADVSQQNIVVSDSVQGNVTLRLQNVPWDQALDIVLRTKGLDMRRRDNVILVAPAEEIAARERQELQARKDLQELEPLRFEFLQVNYAKASDLATLLAAEGRNALLSERGSVSIDERTNTLLLQDTPERLGDIRRLVQTLDIPVHQVLIESRIVIVNDDFSRQLGVRLGATAVTDNSSDGLISVSGSAAGNDTIINSGLGNIQNTGQPFPVATPALNDRFNVNLPVNNPAGRIALAILDEDYLIDLELSALQAEGRGEIVSTPRVIAVNRKEASIEQGVEIPFQEAASSGATTTQFKKAVLSLKVTPQITPDGRIILDMIVSQDSVGEQVPSATGGFVPSINTREVITQVLVNDGETVVLGGIYETERRETANKVPILGDIPGLGVLFRSTQRDSNKAELLIFVTPRILREGANVY
ncbi:MAG TPA: type IV pilus secretin PilQ [Gammaproteobacteria bacterium]|nr:type IV pilus secretin PilQ [Gammaproteobacteria bacterium]